METKIQKAGKSQYGFYLRKEDGSFKSCTEQVNKYLSNKCPCTIVIEATSGEGRNEKISKVRLVSSSGPMTVGQEMQQDTYKGNSKRKESSMCVSYAKDLAVAGKIKVEDIADKARGFMTLIEELATGKLPVALAEKLAEIPEDKEPEFDSGIGEEGEM